MALYAIGDVQGCYESLRRLLDKIRFDPAHDRLWFTGDLVNRGPRSVEVLRFVASLGTQAVSVLGNHDLHLLAVAAGARTLSPRDTLQNVLAAPDRDELIGWLTARPLLHSDADTGFILVHAGLLPEWDVAQAITYARETESVLAGPRANEFFRHMYGDKPDRWQNDLTAWDRYRLIVNAFTRLRFCYPDGCAEFTHKGAPGSQPSPLIPWFAVPARKSRTARIVFGHWSLLGLWNEDGVIGLDTGCLWGRKLTGVRLSGDRREFFSVDCQKPG
jgi:bis(5'-nucleosyl)-tetraphosphatase (symmetrical)